MERRTLPAWLLGLAVLPGVLTVQLPAAPPAAPKIEWHADLGAAHQISVQTDKPMLLLFEAPWCRYCRKLKNNTMTDPQVIQQVNASFVPVHLDFDHNKRIARILKVRSLPCTIVLSPKADLLGKVVGYVEPAKYQKRLQSARQLRARLDDTKQAENR